MQLSALAAEPQLKTITIDDEGLVEKYGEAIEFYVNDRIPLDQFMQLAEVLSADEIDYGQMIEFAKTMMLDKKGNPIIGGTKVLPNDVAMAAMNKVASELGNL